MKRFLASFLCNYRWFRKWHGGKWERWWVDSPVNSFVWHDVEEFTHVMQERTKNETPGEMKPLMDPSWWDHRPSPLCRGTPELEDWS